MTPRVAIDVRMIHHSGIGRYIRGMVRALPNLKLPHWKYALIGHRQDRLEFPADFDYRATNAPIYSISEQVVIPTLAHPFGCLHSPHYNVPLLRKKKLVVTIHDLIHLHFPEHLPSAAAFLYARTILPAACRKADAIIAVSAHTKTDLVRTLRIDPHKITVIHHGIDPAFIRRRGESERNNGGENSYFLYVGLIKAHKNLGILLDAFQAIKQKIGIQSLKLELVGTPDTKQPVVRQWLERIKQDTSLSLQSNVSDAALKTLYRNAAALIQPSLYEGFGFPLLEALASGTPIVASRAASIPEVAGEEGALYFDPHSVSELEGCLEQILTSQALRDKLVQAGQKRLPLFDWDRAAQKTVQVYESVLGTG